MHDLYTATILPRIITAVISVCQPGREPCREPRYRVVRVVETWHQDQDRGIQRACVSAEGFYTDVRRRLSGHLYQERTRCDLQTRTYTVIVVDL